MDNFSVQFYVWGFETIRVVLPFYLLIYRLGAGSALVHPLDVHQMQFLLLSKHAHQEAACMSSFLNQCGSQTCEVMSGNGVSHLRNWGEKIKLVFEKRWTKV